MSKPLTITLSDNSTITYHNPAVVMEGIGDFGEPEIRIIGRPNERGEVYSVEHPQKQPDKRFSKILDGECDD